MDNALYVGLSRQLTLQRALQLAASNIANADTVGFKVEQQMLKTEPLSPPNLHVDPINYVLDQGIARNFGQGPLDQTGNTYDVAIDGDGFFTVQTDQGPRYTRDGRFTVNTQNKLVDKNGHSVLNSSGSEITFNPTQLAPTIGEDGSISQGTGSIGKIGVVRFANLAALKKEGDNLYSVSDGQAPLPAANAHVRQGMVERSNVQPVLEITNLIEITRAYERVATMMNQNQDLASKAIERLGRSN
ncbi:MAG: flagellar basal-body rod protein FlgF [Caulobacteraceae bacterium]